ncbi:MAG: sulfotransferase [Paracoccaceae bacterium]
MTLPFVPVVIVGAPRSGTNMLRDMIAGLPGFATWPCDEVNPVWRHGNLRWPDDEIPAARAGRGRDSIRRAFVRLWRKSGQGRYVVEKTCANSLRVPFVAAVLPEARFVQIIRDGRDATVSAQRCWQGRRTDLAPGYRIAKARFVPPPDLPYYAAQIVARRLRRWTGRDRPPASWGPRFKGIDRLLGRPLEEICARQWLACVERSDAAFAAMPRDIWLRTRYEDIIADPSCAIMRIAAFLGAEGVGPAAIGDAARIAARPTTGAVRVGPGTDDILGAARARHGYAT